MPAQLRAAFEGQARACLQLGSPFMGQLNSLFATRRWPKGQIQDRVFAWPGDVSPRAASVPLRLAGALHALRLQGNVSLAAAYPPHTVGDDALWMAVCEALITEAAFIDQFLNSPPQTNDVRRAAVLIAAGHWLADRYDLPLSVMELGASAGLNLMWDRFALEIDGTHLGPDNPALTLSPTWTGQRPSAGPVRVTDRRGVDLNPIDPVRDGLRLRAYLWPDQPDRLRLTDAAIACHDAQVDQDNAIDWLATRLGPVSGHVRLIYHTIAWQYFPIEAQAKGADLITTAGALATDQSPLAWLGMEADENPDGAALTLRLWPGDEMLALGRVDFHGRWVNWTPPA